MPSPVPTPRTVILIQARMGSSRLPGKVLAPIVGRPMLGRQIDRLRRCRAADAIALAVPTGSADDALVAFAREEGIEIIRGPEDDVLERFRVAAAATDAGTIVRVTADCPLIEPAVVDACIDAFHRSAVDYLSNCQVRTFPRGMDTEVFARQALETAAREAVAADEREHVTPFMYRHPERFRLGSYEASTDESGYRLTVDTDADLLLVRTIFETLLPGSPEFSLTDVLALLGRRPELATINAHVEQKPLGAPLKEGQR